MDLSDAGFRLFAHWRENPAACIHETMGAEPDPHQVEILNAIAYAGLHGNPTGVVARAGHGVGKTTTEAWAVFYFLLTHPLSKVPTTAPTWHQVKNVLWAEIAKWHERFKYKHLFDLLTTKMSVRGREAEWFAIGVASNRAVNIEGFHAPYLLFLVDEAKGVADVIYDAIDGALTQGGIRAYFSTPGSRIGRFYESFHKLAKFFTRIHVNGENVARVSRQWIEQKREEWGVDSPIYQSKVLGEFPQEGDDILIPLDWITAAELTLLEVDEVSGARLFRPGPHRAIGGDIARYGFNETAAASGTSRGIDHLETWRHESIPGTAARLKGLYDNTVHGWTPVPSRVGVDDGGVGGGVTDLLREWNVPVTPVQFGAASEDPEQFFNLKAEMAWKLRAALEANWRARQANQPGTFGLVKDDRLSGQLSNLRRRHAMRRGVPAGLTILDPDDPSIAASELPRGLRTSPDRAHAAMVCYYTATLTAQLGAGRLVTPGAGDDDPDTPRAANLPVRGGLSRYLRERGLSR